MSEKIYACLLRLYPSHFRETYGDAALQLFRDRFRHERGFFPSLRLWLDLLADLAISVPREYRSVQPAFVGASAQQRLDGTPSFHFLEGESPSLGALLFGGVLSLVAVWAFSIPVGHVGKYRPPRASIAATDDAEVETIESVQPAIAATRLRPGDARPNDFQSKPVLPLSAFALPQPPAPQPKPQGAPGAMIQGVKLDAAERQRMIDAAIANLKHYYVYPEVAQKMADALLEYEKSGDYSAVTDGAAFADLLTRQMRDVSHDLHLDVVYSQAPLPNRPPGPTPEGRARYRASMEQQNCTFEKVEILPRNVGYLKLNSFPEPSICRPAATAAMASLNHVDAIIFDLRDNRGGYPSMVMLIAAYLFDHPEYMYNPRENTTERSWTLSPVPGNRLADKPVYVLTSVRTFSGAEHFSYDLKMLKRATLVGETTGGATDVGIFHRIDDHFGMGIRETRAINPYSEPDWAVTGVEPDVKVKAADALERAETLAESKLQKK
jgi:hypothetical protein